jgi:DNA polymerase III alpha subunit
MFTADIDIDTPSGFKPTSLFKIVKASTIDGLNIKPHPCGVYFQNIPVDPISQLSAIPYDAAEAIGYTKVDFLHLTMLDNIPTRSNLIALSNKEPDWDLLLDADIVSKLFQIHNQYHLVSKLKPHSVVELADVLALMRPGKKHLLEPYLLDKITTRKYLYRKPESGDYYYKKSHAIAYAKIIIVQLNVLNTPYDGGYF